jgi:hypothetical protein
MNREPSWRDATSAGITVPETEDGWQARWANDALISIADIRKRFKLGRTAAYELTHRPGFPNPVPIEGRALAAARPSAARPQGDRGEGVSALGRSCRDSCR